MALTEPANRVGLNKITHSVRASQAVLQYGVGAMVDFPDQTLMTAAPEYWQSQVIQLHDERLEKALNVDYFGLPMGQDDPGCRDGISYVRFPEWYFCPKCRKFQTIKEWKKEFNSRATQREKENDPDMVKKLRCPSDHQDLVVARIVTVCECGHIDDFPWVKWVHCRNMLGGPRRVCAHPVLSFKTSASSTEGLEGLTVSCESCGAKATLKDAFDPDIFKNLDEKTNGEYGFRCTGRHPWKHTTDPCDKYPKAIQRGSSSVYFPVTASSLIIPPYSSLITQKVEESIAYANCKTTISSLKTNPNFPKDMMKQFIEGSMNQWASDIALEISAPTDQVKAVLERKWISTDTEEDVTSKIKYRAEEFEALTGKISMPSDGEFVREGTIASEYGIPGVKSVSLIHKIREVQALTGFSRLRPLDADLGANLSDYFVPVKEKETAWYPAYQVRGEGIFIEFDDDVIDDWITENKEMSTRVAVLNDNYKKSYLAESRQRTITAKYLFLHTLSHLLIKQLSFECGYGIASLKERLYCGEEDEGKRMAGIFIYTASGDSEGTLGGLVRQGRSDVFPGIFKKAIETASTCSNDPVCSLSMGQGRDSLNLSACYSCCLILETSCEEFNVFLDRASIVGTYENRSLGFYSPQLYEEKPWVVSHKSKASPSDKKSVTGKMFIVTDEGIDMSEDSYRDIWESLVVFSDDENEIMLLNELAKRSSEFSSLAKPRQNCGFAVAGDTEEYRCDLLWQDKKIALFTADREEDYRVAKETDMICISLVDPGTTVEGIIDLLKEGN